MSGLPDTRSGPRRRTTAHRYAVLAAGLAAAAGATALLSGGEAPERGEEVGAGVVEIAASSREVSFPRTDASGFDAGTPVVRVYLRVEDVPVGEKMVATVERTGRASAFSVLFGGDAVTVDGGDAGRLSVSDRGASGVIPFAVRAADGGTLPAGGYQVEVRFGAGEDGGTGPVVARKYFVIEDPQD